MKDTEIVARLDRIVEILEKMASEQYKGLQEEVKSLHDWRTTCLAIKTTKNNFLGVLRWVAPWLVAFMVVLFDHKFIK